MGYIESGTKVKIKNAQGGQSIYNGNIFTISKVLKFMGDYIDDPDLGQIYVMVEKGDFRTKGLEFGDNEFEVIE